MDISLTSAAAAVVVVALTILYYFIKNRNVLPGPWGLPYLGLYTVLEENTFYLQLEEYKKKYGDVFSFTYTGRMYINLGSVKSMRDLHVNQSECFAERYTDFNVFNYMLSKGVVMVNGEPWKIMRKYFIQRFKDYGLTTVKDNAAGPVYDALNLTIEELKESENKPVSVMDLLTKRCTVTIRKVIFGEDGITDEELTRINTAYSGVLEGFMGASMLLVGPLARISFAVNPKLKECLKGHNHLCDILRTITKKIESTMGDENPTCIIEDYYRERNKRRESNDPTWKVFNDQALIESVLQFVGDGIVGVTAFIANFLFSLAKHPEEQEKVFAELMEVVGPNRQPVLEDKANLPYCNAFISEAMRKFSVLNVFPSLACTRDTTYRGYKIPKGAITLPNFYSANHDSQTYENPEKFNPSRFLSTPDKPKEEIPASFGVGKRSCSGEGFVMMQIFLFLTTIVKNFKLHACSEISENPVDFLLAGNLELTFQARDGKSTTEETRKE